MESSNCRERSRCRSRLKIAIVEKTDEGGDLCGLYLRNLGSAEMLEIHGEVERVGVESVLRKSAFYPKVPDETAQPLRIGHSDLPDSLTPQESTHITQLRHPEQPHRSEIRSGSHRDRSGKS